MIDEIINKLLSIKPLYLINFSRSSKLRSKATLGMNLVMMLLNKHGTLAMSQLSRMMAIPKPNVTALIDKMIDKGLVERIHGENDRRVINIRLTKKGMKLKNEIDNTIKSDISQQLSKLSGEDIILLYESLNKVHSILMKISILDNNLIINK
jgi:DNA-binding MarR family transcriptional regulator